MKELLSLILHLDMKALFVSPTRNALIQFFRYAFVAALPQLLTGRFFGGWSILGCTTWWLA